LPNTLVSFGSTSSVIIISVSAGFFIPIDINTLRKGKGQHAAVERSLLIPFLPAVHSLLTPTFAADI